MSNVPTPNASKRESSAKLRSVYDPPRPEHRDYDMVARALADGQPVKLRRDGPLTTDDPNVPGYVTKITRVAAGSKPSVHRKAKAKFQVWAGAKKSAPPKAPVEPELRVHLPPSQADVIRREVLASTVNETGGGLLGRREGNDLFLFKVTSCGPEADHQPLEFLLDERYVQAELDAQQRQSNTHYLGMYHKHPGRMRVPSSIDAQGMRDMMEKPGMLPYQISIIATVDKAGDVLLDTYFMEKGGTLRRAKLVTYDQDEDPFARVRPVLNVDALARKTVTVFGAGSVGSIATVELAKCGVGTIRVVDHDVLAHANLSRHAAGRSFVGYPKVDAVARLIKDRNPNAKVETHFTKVSTEETIHLLVQGSDVVICAIDDKPAMHMINRVCVKLGIPCFFAGVYPGGDGGDVFRAMPGKACFEDFDRHNSLAARPGPGVAVDYEHGGVIEAAPGIGLRVSFVCMLLTAWVVRTLLPAAAETYWSKTLVQWTNIVDRDFPKPYHAEFHTLPIHPKCTTCHADPRAPAPTPLGKDVGFGPLRALLPAASPTGPLKSGR